MRAPRLLLATFFTMLGLGVGCSEHVLTQSPTADGYGPAGGAEHSSGSSSGSSGGSSTPPASSATPPSPPPTGGSSSSGGGSSTSSGSTSSSGGTGSTGFDAGTFEAGGGFDAGTSGDGGDVSALLPLCVSQINEFRNQNGENPLTESASLESYAAAASASDAHNQQLHSYFYATSGGGGVAATEDELDGAKVAPGASAQQTMEQGLQNDENANGGAAANLLDQQFSEAGCGFGQDASGNWWVVIGLH
ncbi:MAG TPA: CAP domain-containing protein [Polyangiaceae bacterium]